MISLQSPYHLPRVVCIIVLGYSTKCDKLCYFIGYKLDTAELNEAWINKPISIFD